MRVSTLEQEKGAKQNNGDSSSYLLLDTYYVQDSELHDFYSLFV